MKAMPLVFFTLLFIIAAIISSAYAHQNVISLKVQPLNITNKVNAHTNDNNIINRHNFTLSDPLIVLSNHTLNDKQTPSISNMGKANNQFLTCAMIFNDKLQNFMSRFSSIPHSNAQITVM